MAGRKKTRKSEKPVGVDELRPWSDLPTELVELIVSCLCLEDNVRLSCVCKKWQNVFRSLRVVNQSPWLLFFLAKDGKIKFFDPSQGKFYIYEIPILKDTYTYIHCSKDGWVFFSQTYSNFLVNPFTNSTIQLPRGNSLFPCYSARLALSCAPTSPDSVLLSIETYGQSIDIHLWHPGDTQWTTIKYQNSTDGILFRCGHDPVFCNGLFYCLSESNNFLGIFDPQKHTWRILPLPPPNFPHLSIDRQRTEHMVEFNGELLLVCVSYPDKPIIIKLNLSEMKWVEMDSLNGVTLFVSSHSSFSATDVPRISRNSIYFSKHRGYGKSSYFYSLDDCRYHPPKQCHDARRFTKAVWIEPPKMSHLLFEELY